MSNQIFTQFKNLHEDKLLVCQKELKHIHRVLSFYHARGEKLKVTTNFSEIQSMLNQQLEHIKLIYADVLETFDEIQSKKIFHYEFLAMNALIDKKISALLEQTDLLSNKLTQFTEEHFDQYIPRANLERRYSNKAITFFIDDYFNQLVYGAKEYEQKKVLNLWARENKYKAVDINDDLKIIQNSFWYYEISRLIPALVHEVGHLLHNKGENQLENEIKQQLENEISEYKYLQGVEEEIASDLFALEHVGVSFIFAFFYTQISNDFDDIAYDVEYKTCFVPDFDVAKNDKHRKSFELFLRLKILITKYLFSEVDDEKPLVEHVEQIGIFIEKIFSTKVTPSSLQQIYSENYVHLVAKYNETCQLIEDITDAVMFATTEDIKGKFFKTKINYQQIFSNIWLKHFENNQMWVHPNNFRHELLKEILSEDCKSELNGNYSPYELTFYKTRVDVEEPSKEIIKKSYMNNPFFPDTSGGVPIYNTLGIYSYISNLKKTSLIRRKNIQQYITNEEFDNTAFYTQKMPLVLLHEKDLGDDANSKENIYGVIMQIQNQQKLSELDSDLKDLKRTIEEKKVSARYKIFKSLGPGDFILFIENISIDCIYDLKEMFAEKSAFRRTFSTIFIMKENLDEYKLSNKLKDYRLISKLRISSDGGKNLKDRLSNEDCSSHIDKIYHTSGVTDYEVSWNLEKSLQSIFDQITKFKKDKDNKEMVSDIQTFIQHVEK